MKVKALILAGGFATRLRPLSCSRPKLLFPVVAVPLIDRMISWLREANVRKVVLAVNHLSDRLKTEIGRERLGSRIQYSVEETPLGTAGPIRLARRYLDSDEPFVVLNGDIVSDIKLRALVDLHISNSAVATIALTKVPDPGQFGSVAVSPNGRITAFNEKKQPTAGSGLINAGAYVLDPKVIAMIPENGPVSLERAIFPRLVSRKVMWGMIHTGFWYDIGRISDYVKANMSMLGTLDMTWDSRRASRARRWTARDPLRVGTGFRAGSGARVGPNAILSDRVSVGEGSSVRDSIVFEDTAIGADCSVDGALIGERVRVGSKSQIRKGAIVAGELTIPAGTVIERGSIVLN